MKKSIGAGLIVLAFTGCGGGGGTATPAAPPVAIAPQPVAQNAGIFVQPAIFTTINPTTEANAAQAQVKAASKVAAPANFPTYNPATQILTLPGVKVDEISYSAVQLHLDGDGLFSLTNSPEKSQQSTQSSSSYSSKTGMLTINLMGVEDGRYSKVQLHLEMNGKFKLVAASAATFTDYVELLSDVFTGGNVGTHYSLVTTIQQLQDGANGDVLMVGNAYWDFALQGLDRFRAGPQNLLRWNGKSFDDISASAVVGGIPNMFQVETEKMVADFNGDGRLDVVLGGNGPDGAGNKGEPTYALLSQGLSNYVLKQLPNNAGLPDYNSWAHGGAAVKLRDKSRKVAFIGDYTFGPSYLVEIAADGSSNKMSGRLPDFIGTASTAMNGYFTSADFPVTAALGVDLDGDGVDELVLGSLYSYSAALTNPTLNSINTLVLKQDASGSFAASPITALPNGPFAKIDCYQKANCESLTVKQITTADFNADGLPDLLITHHSYNTSSGGGSKSQLLINKGGLKFEDATVAWFGTDLKLTNASHIHSYPADLNGDGCTDAVLRGDEINSAPVRVFLNDCKGHMVEFSKEFQALMPTGSKYMHGGVPVTLEGKPAILLFNMMGSSAKFSVVRFKHNIPTPTSGTVKY
ncbi:hypothetical protein IWX79_004336 [Janthinobacterium sp. CAN_S1]|uniref:FG-GAP repeat domain-containing protein n=1 Tax=Janthinobacterium sp. CAN_S1 TaxID=2787725 RepID=UPI0018CAD6B9